AYDRPVRFSVGDVLAEGTYSAAKKISQMKGVDVTRYAVHVKGVEIGAHGTRSGRDMNPIGYAANVQGGDHTSSVYDGYDDMGMVFLDSAVVCAFVARGELTWRYLDAVTGWGITREEWNKVLAKRIIAIQRAAELIGGPDVRWNPATDDDNPPRYYEPLPTGPHAGKTTDKSAVEQRKKEYYKAVGWDENGIPRSDVLKELGLEDVDKALNKVRP
ncbi:MAG: aldehyde ferredoxin oxidoreductase C-terminal domain-containing protein, partial [Candidatus Bathyarchaeia archaeon]